MTVLDILRHQWYRQIRSPTWGRSLIAGLVLGAAVCYFGGLFVAAGWFYPQMVAEVVPQQDPLQLLNEFLLYGVVGLVPVRFVLQRSPGSDVQPYLGLPLRRAQIVRIMQALSALSLLNLLPILVLASLWGSTVWTATSVLGATVWGLGALLLVATTQFLNTILRAVWDRNAGLVLGTAGFLVVAMSFNIWGGTGAIRGVSGWLFGGLAAGRLLPLLVLVAAAGGSAGAAHWSLRSRLYEILGDASAGTVARTGARLLGRRWEGGDVASLALLDLKLFLRNKRPRQMLLLGVFVIAMFCMATITGESPTAANKILFGFFLSGYLGIMVGQFGYAWHGGHFDRLLHAARPTTLVRAQFLTVAGLCAVPLLLVIPVAGVLQPSLLVSLFALLIYNLGITAPVLILMGTWRREALELDQTAVFNYQGTMSDSFVYAMLLVLGVMGGPLLIALGLGSRPALLFVGGLGIVGLGAAPFWIRGLGRMLRRQRHAMATGFRDE